jgi:hypothetical protein
MWSEVSFGEVEVRAADATGRHPDQNLVRRRSGIGPFTGSERRGVDRARLFDPPREHGADHRTGATMQS